MCRSRVVVLVCATALVGPVIAQDAVAPDNVGTRTTTLLALEWNETASGGASGVILCLRALDAYTAHDLGGALAQLRAGISQIPKIDVAPLSGYAGKRPEFPGANGLYTKAHEDGRMPDLLAKATTLTIDANDEKSKKKLFDEANKNIKDTYGSSLTGLDRVFKMYREDSALALYNLLKDLKDLLPAPAQAILGKPTPSDDEKKLAEKALSPVAKKMEVYRTCYLLDKFRLFGLVRDFLKDQ